MEIMGFNSGAQLGGIRLEFAPRPQVWPPVRGLWPETVTPGVIMVTGHAGSFWKE